MFATFFLNQNIPVLAVLRHMWIISFFKAQIIWDAFNNTDIILLLLFLLLLSVNGSDSTISASTAEKDELLSITVGGILAACAVIIVAVVVLVLRYMCFNNYVAAIRLTGFHINQIF